MGEKSSSSIGKTKKTSGRFRRRDGNKQEGPDQRGGRRKKRPFQKRKPKEWIPRTDLGQAVKSGLITSIEEIFQNNYKVRETEIFDALISNLKEEVVTINMVQKMTDSGQQSRFKATVVIGNHDGYVGMSSITNKEVGPAIRKSIERAKLAIIPVKRGCGSWECNCGGNHSIPYVIYGKCGSVKVRIKPAAKGTGIVASGAAKIPLNLGGIKDCYVYIKGNSRNPENTSKAVISALKNAYKIMNPADWSK
ncbi:MAG: 30S ribosomal protein S5 [Promethearchaeota archaeon]